MFDNFPQVQIFTMLVFDPGLEFFHARFNASRKMTILYTKVDWMAILEVSGLPFQTWEKIVYCFVLLAGRVEYFSFD
jgi:hypothetical protein